MRTGIIQVVAITFLALAVFSYPACALERVSVSGTDAGAITLKAENSPLNDLVRELTRKCGLDLKGSSLSNEGAYLDLAESPLEDVLKKLLRGYNYVLIKPDGSGRGSLTIFGKVERVALSYPAPSAVSASSSDYSGGQTPSTGETGAASSSGREFFESAEGRSSPSRAMAQGGSGDASGGAQAGGARGTVQNAAAASSGTSPALTGLTPPSPPQIAGHDLPPQIPSALLGGAKTASSQSGSGSTSASGSILLTPPAPPQIPHL